MPASLLAEPSEDAVRARVEDDNRRVKEDRLQPDPSLPRTIIAPLADVEEMLAAWRAAR